MVAAGMKREVCRFWRNLEVKTNRSCLCIGESKKRAEDHCVQLSGNVGGDSIFVEKDDEVRCKRDYLCNRNGGVITNQHRHYM